MNLKVYHPVLICGSIIDHYWTLKGQLLHARGQYDSALYYYNYAIALNPSSEARVQRALTFIKMKQYAKAISDYKFAYERNYDFSYNLAVAFELNTQKDSAIKYYKIYLKHYPDSLVKELERQGVYLKHPPNSARKKIQELDQ